MAIKNSDIAKLEELSKLKENFVISDLSRYEISQNGDKKALNSELLRGFVLLEEGFELLKEKKIKEAKLKFAQINPESGLGKIAKNLSHYQGK